jgi:hypothetical protein
LARAHQHAAVASTQRKNVARTNKVRGTGAVGNGGLNRSRSVGRADSRRNVVGGIDTDRESGSEASRVVKRLGVQTQRVTLGGRQRQANQAPAEPRHEIDDFRGDFLGRADQVPLILTVVRIDKHYHLTRKQILKDLRYFTKLCFHLSEYLIQKSEAATGNLPPTTVSYLLLRAAGFVRQTLFVGFNITTSVADVNKRRQKSGSGRGPPQDAQEPNPTR